MTWNGFAQVIFGLIAVLLCVVVHQRSRRGRGMDMVSYLFLAIAIMAGASAIGVNIPNKIIAGLAKITGGPSARAK